MNKNILILTMCIFWIYPALAKDCADIPIFKKFIELSACELERRLEYTLKDLTDIKITKFRRRRLADIKRVKYGLLRFSGSYQGETIHLRCNRVRIYEENQDLVIKISNCKNKNYRLLGEKKSIELAYPIAITKRHWIDKGRKVIK